MSEQTTEIEAARFAWDQCAKEAHDLGWLHDWALSDLLGRNPWRVTTPPETRCCTSHHFEGCTDGGPGCCARCPINPTDDEGASA